MNAMVQSNPSQSTSHTPSASNQSFQSSNSWRPAQAQPSTQLSSSVQNPPQVPNQFRSHPPAPPIQPAPYQSSPNPANSAPSIWSRSTPTQTNSLNSNQTPQANFNQPRNGTNINTSYGQQQSTMMKQSMQPAGASSSHKPFPSSIAPSSSSAYQPPPSQAQHPPPSISASSFMSRAPGMSSQTPSQAPFNRPVNTAAPMGTTNPVQPAQWNHQAAAPVSAPQISTNTNPMPMWKPNIPTQSAAPNAANPSTTSSTPASTGNIWSNVRNMPHPQQHQQQHPNRPIHTNPAAHSNTTFPSAAPKADVKVQQAEFMSHFQQLPSKAAPSSTATPTSVPPGPRPTINANSQPSAIPLCRGHGLAMLTGISRQPESQGQRYWHCPLRFSVPTEKCNTWVWEKVSRSIGTQWTKFPLRFVFSPNLLFSYGLS